MRTLVANAPVVLLALDGDGVITASEGRGLEALGCEPNELVKRSIFDLYRDNLMLLELTRRALFVKAEAREQEVWAYRYRVGQVLRNLLSNAANYSPEGEPVELRTMVDRDYGCVEVADRGPGIHPDEASHVVEKFGRGRDPSGRRVVGVGVSLHLLRRIMKAHGGDPMMNATPEAGSVFGFKLKLVR